MLMNMKEILAVAKEHRFARFTRMSFVLRDRILWQVCVSVP